MSEKSLEIRHFQAFAHLEEPGVPGPSNSLGRGRMKKTASTQAIPCIIEGAQDSKKEILAEISSVTGTGSG